MLTNPHQLIAISQHPDYLDAAITYFSEAFGIPEEIYRDSITASLTTTSTLPRFYVLVKGTELVGCFGLITNDFNSRQDLYPWLAALFVSEKYRGQGLGKLLIQHAVSEVKEMGYPSLYLVTDHTSYYEKFGFEHLGNAYGLDGQARLYAYQI